MNSSLQIYTVLKYSPQPLPERYLLVSAGYILHLQLFILICYEDMLETLLPDKTP